MVDAIGVFSAVTGPNGIAGVAPYTMRAAGVSTGTISVADAVAGTTDGAGVSVGTIGVSGITPAPGVVTGVVAFTTSVGCAANVGAGAGGGTRETSVRDSAKSAVRSRRSGSDTSLRSY